MRRQAEAALRSRPPPPTTPKTEATETPMPHHAFTRWRPLLLKKSRGAGCAEVAGGTAADCAAIFCCCPIGLFNLLVLATVKLPAGLCRRAMKKKRCKKESDSFRTTERGLLGPSVRMTEEDEKSVVVGMQQVFGGVVLAWPERSLSEEESAMEEEMWAKFHGAGFWRSRSRIE